MRLTSYPVIHPYYKLHWIELHWGGAETQAAEIAMGNLNAKNWVDEAEKIVEAKVCVPLRVHIFFTDVVQMEEYWEKRVELPEAVTTTTTVSSDEDTEDNDGGDNDDDSNDSDAFPNDQSSVAAPSSPGNRSDDDDETPDIMFAKYRAQKAAAAKKSGFSGWRAELRSWNHSVSPNHTANMDLCKYWAVRRIFFNGFVFLTLFSETRT